MNGVLYYDTPATRYADIYGDKRLFAENEHQITTQLPRKIALVRIVATVALTVLLAATVAWPLVFVGAALAAWTAYRHLLSKDPLTEVFYRIVGEKDRFAQLPEIRLEQGPNEKICTAISRLEWEHLQHPMYRATTADARTIIIVKGMSRPRDSIVYANTKSVLAFIEKVGPEDIPRAISNLPELVESVFHAICPPFAGNTFGKWLSSSSSAIVPISGQTVSDSYETRICSSITTSMANEFFAQMTAGE